MYNIKDYIKDFLPYSVMTLGAYVFFSGFLRIKASESKISGGGIGDGFKNINSTALTVYIGVLLMVVNAFGLSYFYLKQKALFRKDGILVHYIGHKLLHDYWWFNCFVCSLFTWYFKWWTI